MKALVTGGAGLIGSHLVDLLLGRGAEVTILDVLEPQTHPNGRPSWIPSEARFVQGDVRDVDALADALTGVDVVFHQAAFGGFTDQMSHYLDVNATGTARIFEVVRNQGLDIRKVVLASSQAIFGEGPYRRSDGSTFHPPLRPLAQLDAGDWEVRDPDSGAALEPLRAGEELSPDGITPYALSKYFEERAGLALGRSLGIPVVALRYAVTYGPRQSVHNPYTGVISIFASRLLNGMPPVVFEDGLQTRDFIFVEDVARANLHVMESDEIGDDVLNVGTGVPTRMLDLAHDIASVLDLRIAPHLPGEYRPGDVRHFVHDPAKMNHLGFVAEHSVRAGLARFAEWVSTQGPIEERFSAAATQLRAMGVIRPAGAPSGR